MEEGDINTGFLRRAVNKRRKVNEIGGIQIGDEWIENPEAVKNGIKELFLNQFKKRQPVLPTLDPSLSFKKVSAEDNLSFIADFLEKRSYRGVIVRTRRDRGQTDSISASTSQAGK